MKRKEVRPEELLGKRVTHFVFGKGKVTRVQGAYIVVSFHGTERMFECPAAFGEYLTIEDKRLQKLLPVCEKQPPQERPVFSGRRPGYVRDEYDTVILADLVRCTI